MDANNNKQQYGVIHEMGDYSNFKKLDEQQNDDYNRQLLEEQQRKQKERKNK